LIATCAPEAIGIALPDDVAAAVPAATQQVTDPALKMVI
jgi:hypothetical protein